MVEAIEYRTIMYSVRHDVGHEGEVVKHRFPWNPRDAGGMEKLQKMVERGFSFADPRKGVGFVFPEVIVTKRAGIEKPREEENLEENLVPDDIPPNELKTEEAPLYISDKPKVKPRKKRRSKKSQKEIK